MYYDASCPLPLRPRLRTQNYRMGAYRLLLIYRSLEIVENLGLVK